MTLLTIMLLPFLMSEHTSFPAVKRNFSGQALDEDGNVVAPPNETQTLTKQVDTLLHVVNNVQSSVDEIKAAMPPQSPPKLPTFDPN